MDKEQYTQTVQSQTEIITVCQTKISVQEEKISLCKKEISRQKAKIKDAENIIDSARHAYLQALIDQKGISFDKLLELIQQQNQQG